MAVLVAPMLRQGSEIAGLTNRLDLVDIEQKWIHVHVAVMAIGSELGYEHHIHLNAPLLMVDGSSDLPSGSVLPVFLELNPCHWNWRGARRRCYCSQFEIGFIECANPDKLVLERIGMMSGVNYSFRSTTTIIPDSR